MGDTEPSEWGGGASPDAESSTESDSPTATDSSSRSPPISKIRPILVAVGLGLSGPILAIILTVPILLVDLAVGLPQLAFLALVLIAGQYVAFGGLALGYLHFRGFDWNGVRSYLGVDVPDFRDLIVVISGWVAMVAMVYLIGILLTVLGTEAAENQTAVDAFENPEIIPPLIIGMLLVVGPSEEILYRGVVQGRLRERFGPVLSISLASIVFASVHYAALSGGDAARVVTISILFVMSLVFGIVYEYTDNLVVPALVHGLYNSFLLAMLYLVAVFGPEDLEELRQQAMLALPL